jgi:hypothetical protein
MKWPGIHCPDALLAIDLVVLRGNNLPFAHAFQPGIGPDLAHHRVGMHFVFADGMLAAVNDGDVLSRRRSREEAHLGIVECAAVRRAWALFIAQLVRLVEALAASAGP